MDTSRAPKPLEAKPQLLPMWVLGLANLPLGITGGLTLLAVPQLLAARHVSEPVIAGVTTIALIPTFAAFLTGPLLDIRFSRRAYAVAATILAAVGSFFALLTTGRLVLLSIAVFVAIAGAAINSIAIGGWFGSLVREEDDADLGAWMNVANTVGFGLSAMIAVQLVRALPLPVAALLLSLPVLAPLLVYAVTPAPPPDRRLARETFGQFFRHIGALVRQPQVLQLLLLFGVPAASFALTNTLGGLGSDYHASERFVALLGGAAVTVAGTFGSLIVPPLVRRMAPRPFYLVIGISGALFTLVLTLLPRTPLTFGLAMVGENVAQSAALATATVVALQSLGRDNPLAATQYGLINCMAALPITYMQMLDGQAYGFGGLSAMYLTDAGLGLTACMIMAVLLRLWRLLPASVTADASAL